MRQIRILILDDELNPITQLVTFLKEMMPEQIVPPISKEMISEWNKNKPGLKWNEKSILGQITAASVSGQFQSSFLPTDWPSTREYLGDFLRLLPISIEVYHVSDAVLKIDDGKIEGRLEETDWDIVVSDWKLTGYEELRNHGSPLGLMGNRILLYASHKGAIVGFYSACEGDMIGDPDNAIVYKILRDKGLEKISKTQLGKGIYSLYRLFLSHFLKDVDYKPLFDIEELIRKLETKEPKDSIQWAESKEALVKIGKDDFSLYTLCPFLVWSYAKKNTDKTEEYKKDILSITDKGKRNTAVGLIRSMYNDGQLINPFLHGVQLAQLEEKRNVLVRLSILFDCIHADGPGETSISQLKYDICRKFLTLKVSPRSLRQEFRLCWSSNCSPPEDPSYTEILEILQNISRDLKQSKDSLISSCATKIEQNLPEPLIKKKFSYFCKDYFYDGLKGLLEEICTRGKGISKIELTSKENAIDFKIYQNNKNLTGILEAHSRLKNSTDKLKLFCRVIAVGEFNGKPRTYDFGGFFPDEDYDCPSNEALWILSFLVFLPSEED